MKFYAKNQFSATLLEHLDFKDALEPPHLELDIDWQKLISSSGLKNNILGGNSQVLIAHRSIEIPVLVATQKYLAYFHAYLVQPEEYIQFSAPPYPIWKMKISKNYVSRFLMSKEGGGFYLEYHHDVPHYHQNINGQGYYILGKPNQDFTKIKLTAFIIPKGHAIYTSNGTIHCDAALTGKYLVGYHLSKHYSTALLRQKQNPEEMVQVLFKNTFITN